MFKCQLTIYETGTHLHIMKPLSRTPPQLFITFTCLLLYHFILRSMCFFYTLFYFVQQDPSSHCLPTITSFVSRIKPTTIKYIKLNSKLSYITAINFVHPTYQIRSRPQGTPFGWLLL